MKKNISYRSSELLSVLTERGKEFFTSEDANNILSSSEPVAVRRLLSDMARRGLILRLKDGLYAVIPYEKDAENYFPNWHLAAEAIVQPLEYYIGFYSALDIHGLITQPSLAEQVVTREQVVPKYRTVRNVKFEFITLGRRFFGYKKTWINDFDKICCSDMEKTILDCLYMPGKANGVTEVVKAIHRGIAKLSPDKLFEYLKRMDSQSVFKRLGFLLQELDAMPDLRRELGGEISNSYAVLDPSLPKSGDYYSRWKILDNVGIEAALQSVVT